MLEYLSIGQIVNTHGVKGEVKIYPLTNNIERFKKLKEVYLDKNGSLTKYAVTSAKLLKNMAVLKLEGIDSVEAAQKLRSCYIKVDRDKAVKLPKDNYFIADLIDLEVYELNGELLGRVKDVIHTGSNDVYVVMSEKDEEILIPALKSVILEINLESKRITAKLPEGLLE